MRKYKGKAMIKTISQMQFSDIDYISIKCNRCKGEFNFQSTDFNHKLMRGCPLCEKAWQKEEIEAIGELSKAYWILKESHRHENFLLSFISIEEQR